MMIGFISGTADGKRLWYQDGSAWKTIIAGTTIGTDYRKSFPAVTASVVRLGILQATEGPTVDEFEILK